METIEPSGTASSGTTHELNFLLVRDSSGDWPRWKKAAIGSAIFHCFAITALFLIKGSSYEPPPPDRLYVPHIVPLYIPKDLTQKAPNKGPVAKVMTVPPIAPKPKLTEPPPKPARAAAPLPPAPVARPAPVQPPPVTVPPPSSPAPAEVARIQPPASTPPPPPVAKPDAPKMIVEDSIQANKPAPKAGILSAPNPSVQEAMREIARGGTSSLRTEVGDSDEIGAGAGLNLSPSALRPRSNLQLKSDPMGVDFKPYLLQVLQAVRTSWFAVFPEAARLGQRGQVVLEFAVTKNGVVAKVVYAGQSGAKALDQAAVAAISASNPLPPLPREFKGDQIVLQMSFMYNMPR
jgi:TonB family protein